MTRQAAGRQEFVLAGVLSSFAIRPLAGVEEYGRCTLVVHVVVTTLTPLLDETRVGRSFHATKHWTNASRRRPQDGCFVDRGEHAIAHHPGEVMTLQISNPFG